MAGAKTSLEAVVLDAGGVLLLPDPAAFRKHLAPFGVTPDDEACVLAHYLGMAVVDRLELADFDEADRAIARFLGVEEALVGEAGHAVNAAYRIEPFVPVPGAAEQMLRMQRAGYALAIVSNASGTVEEQLASHHICSVDGDVAAEVAVVVDSHVVGVEKPDPAIFSFALEALGLRPESCVYIGDSRHFDVAGASAAGIPAVHLSPVPACAPDEHPHVAALSAFVDDLLA